MRFDKDSMKKGIQVCLYLKVNLKSRVRHIFKIL